MRFTRPGARPCQPDTSECAELGGRVLGPCVQDERAGTELRARQILELVAAAVRWIELDVKVVVAAASARRLLMHRHHIRKRALEEPVVSLQNTLQDRSQRCVLLPVEVEEPGSMLARSDVHLVRPAGELGDERDPALIRQHSSLASPLALENVAVEAAAGLVPVSSLRVQLALEDGWNEGIGVDLAVWMAERYPNRLTAVLEDVDVAHFRQPAEFPGAVAPHLDQVLDVVERLLTQRGIVDGCVADHLAAALIAGESRETVLEDRDVVIRLGDLRFELARPRRAQRAVVGRRMIRAVLSPGCDGDPLLEQGVPAKLAQARS